MFVLLLCTNTAAVKEPKIIEKRAIFILLKRSLVEEGTVGWEPERV